MERSGSSDRTVDIDSIDPVADDEEDGPVPSSTAEKCVSSRHSCFVYGTNAPCRRAKLRRTSRSLTDLSRIRSRSAGRAGSTKRTQTPLLRPCKW